MKLFSPPINLQKWISDHKEFLKPPVCNKLVFQENGFIIMVVGGPNNRQDFHYNEGPEFFYQIKGDIILNIILNKKKQSTLIKEGEMFLLPAKIPHSPQRTKDSIGIVIERSRTKNELDALFWYCEKCLGILHQEYFKMENIERDLPIIFDKYYSNQEYRTCKSCAFIMQKKEPSNA